ncbi:MAG: M50 family metallopeptidase [Candidatus Limnocylindria bacterium]|nr:site-2 protease family protein [Chloroflexota bacterium]MDQ3400600.1 M50 family metallopeptidase [Chloroflexota bacterium]
MEILGSLRTLAIFLLVFTLIIAVHEFGHYLTARLLGMKVLEFAFGFPPRAVGVRHAEIDYTLNWIPFGGFVRILGQDDFSIKQQGEGDPRAFTSKPWWAQAIVLVAGVTMNFVLALVVLTAAFAMGTTGPTGEVRVAERGVAAGSPAEVAGFQPGDIVVSVDGRKVSTTRELIQYTRRNVEKEIALEVMRNGRPIPTVRAIPRAEPPEGEGPLGIKIEDVQGPMAVGVPEAFGQAWALSGEVVTQILELPGQLIGRGGSGTGPAPEVTGPVGIFQVTGQVAELGLPTLLKLVGVLSVNLGVLNIVPFPGLDGGRLFFVLVAGLFRRRLSPQLEAGIHAAGFVLLLALLVLVSISDIRRAVGG